MAKSPIVLLNNVDVQGTGQIFDLEDKPITPILFRFEFSQDFLVDTNQAQGPFVRLSSSINASFPVVPPAYEGPLTAAIAEFPLLTLENGTNIKTAVGYSFSGTNLRLVNESFGVRRIVLPYVRAELLYPILQGHVTLKFFFE